MKPSLFALLFALPALGAPLPWIEIRAVDYGYRDAGWACEATYASAAVYFSGEVEDGKLTRGFFRKDPSWTETVELSRDEVTATELFIDDKGRYFLASLPLGGPRAAWVYHSLAPLIACLVAPPKALHIAPDPLAFEFEMEAVKEGVGVSYSERVKFSGVTARGNFSGSLRLKQRHW